MATLSDIVVTLTLDVTEFEKKLKSVTKDIQKMSKDVSKNTKGMADSVSKSTVKMSKDFQKISSSSEAISKKVMNTSSDFKESMAMFAGTSNGAGKSFTSIEKIVSKSSKNIENHLKKVTKEVVKAEKTAKKASEETVKSSKTLVRTLGTEFKDVQAVLKSARKEFEEFGSNSYEVSQHVREHFSALPKHLQRYVQRLQDAGKSTASFSRLNDDYGDRIVKRWSLTNQHLINKTTQATHMIRVLKEMDIQPLSRQFLKLGDRLEQNAKQGSALNLAFEQLGRNASLKQIQERVQLIQRGVERTRVTMMGWGIASGLALWGLVLLSNEVDGRLIPAFDELKSVWADALTPFVNAFTTFVLWLMDGATAIGELMKKFAEAHPLLSQMFWGFLLLTMVLTTLLAPLAVAIGLTGGLRAGFTALWAAIAPFILGSLTVLGVTLLIAGAIVVLVASINQLWTYSENFRNAWINIWSTVKEMFVNSFVQPVSQAWGKLKESFSNLIATVTGGAGTMGNLWTWLGDHLAVVINGIASVVLPILNGAFAIMGQIVVGIINGIIVVIDWLSAKWAEHGDKISEVVGIIWNYIKIGFDSIRSFIGQIMPEIQSTISDGFNLIKAIIGFVAEYIYPVVAQAFQYIWAVIQAVMPFVLALIVSTWTNIKNVITSAIAIVQNVIQLFTNILQGNWKGAWENVKNILKNAVTLVWNLVQIYFVGKLLKFFKTFGGKVWNALKDLGSKMLSPFKKGWDSVKKKVTDMRKGVSDKMAETKKGVTDKLSDLKDKLLKPFSNGWNAVKSKVSDMKSGVTSRMGSMVSSIGSKLSGLKSKITKPFTSAWDAIKGIPGKIKSAFSKMKISIPKFKTPSISVGSKSFLDGKVKVPTFKVNWNAKGNIFNGASILGGGQGVGEAGAEVVMPIERKRYMKPYASMVADLMSKDKGQQNSGPNQYVIQFNEPVVIREQADIQRIVDEMEKRQRIEERSQGIFSFQRG